MMGSQIKAVANVKVKTCVPKRVDDQVVEYVAQHRHRPLSQRAIR